MKLFSLRKIILPILIFSFSFLIYLFSNLQHPDWYKHFVYLANAFLHGKTYIENYPYYYLDLILINGKVYLPNPPLPAIILMPFVAIWGVLINEVIISQFLGAINVVLAYFLLKRLSLSKKSTLFLTILFGFGTVHYSASIIGTTWFFAHVVATTFLLLALIEFFGAKRPFLMGFCLGLAFLSRQAVILSVPFFVLPFIFSEDISPKKFFSLLPLRFFLGKTLLFFSALIIPVSFQFFYNFIRFGNIFESGYLLQNWYSSVQADVIETYGFFNIHYIFQHLEILFLKVPEFINMFPYFKPSPWGLSIFLTTPMVIYAFRARFKNPVNLFALISIFLILFPSLIYTATGWVQFGYRYSLDFWPFLLILIASGIKNNINVVKATLIFLSVLINIWGVYWIND